MGRIEEFKQRYEKHREKYKAMSAQEMNALADAQYTKHKQEGPSALARVYAAGVMLMKTRSKEEEQHLMVLGVEIGLVAAALVTLHEAQNMSDVLSKETLERVGWVLGRPVHNTMPLAEQAAKGFLVG